MTGSRVLVVGLDGATWDVIFPLMEQGKLPNLQHLVKGGSFGYLNSTTPPMTLPSWSSMLTGCNPGKHGIFDFVHKKQNQWNLEFTNSTFREVPTIHQIISKQGGRVVSVAVPTTWPPQELNGIVISGFDSPVSTGIDRTFCYPQNIYDEIHRKFGGMCFADFQESRIDHDWHLFAKKSLLKEIERKEKIAQWILQKERWDMFMFLFGESDTVSHHFWRFYDSKSPRFDGSSAELSTAIPDVYCALDKMLGAVIESANPEYICLCSDHGFGGAGTHAVYLNRYLEETGWLQYKRRAVFSPVLDMSKMGFSKYVPSSVQGRIYRIVPNFIINQMESSSRFGNIKMSKTKFVSDEMNYAATLRSNHINAEFSSEIFGQLQHDLLRWEVDGQPVIKKIYRREDIYWGDFVHRSPEIILELHEREGYTYTMLPSIRSNQSWRLLHPHEYSGGKGLGMNGTHRQHGVFLIYGGDIPSVQIEHMDMWDIAPTLLYALDAEIPSYMDGTIKIPLDPTRPSKYTDQFDRWNQQNTTEEFNTKQNEELRRRLEKLGYL